MEYCCLVAEKPRLFQNSRDMILSLGVIVLLMVGSVAFTGMCSFEPGRPENGPVREVDAATFLSMEARSADFPVVNPDVPEGWVANSARRSTVDSRPAPVIGYVTDNGGFLQLTQTGVSAEDTATGIDSAFRERTDSVDIGGHVAQVYTSEDPQVRDVWVVDTGDVCLAVSGAAEREEFAELFQAALRAEPLPRG